MYVESLFFYRNKICLAWDVRVRCAYMIGRGEGGMVSSSPKNAP